LIYNSNLLKRNNGAAVEDVVGQDELVLAHRAHMSVEEVRTLQRSLRLAYAATPIPATLLLQQARAHHHSLGLSVGLTAYDRTRHDTRATAHTAHDDTRHTRRLDELLGGGGLRAGEVTEVVGGAAAGKTALCLQACASALADPTATIAFVDSANAFTPTRLLPLLPHVRSQSTTINWRMPHAPPHTPHTNVATGGRPM
jgi:hypothetical protein